MLNRPPLRTDVNRGWHTFRSATILLCVGSISGCKPGSIMCPLSIPDLIEVEVRDAATGAPAARGASGTISTGSKVWQLALPGSTEELRLYPVMNDQAGAWGPGLYDVLVQKPGYRDWTRNNVRVTANECGIEQVELRANLETSS